MGDPVGVVVLHARADGEIGEARYAMYLHSTLRHGHFTVASRATLATGCRGTGLIIHLFGPRSVEWR